MKCKAGFHYELSHPLVAPKYLMIIHTLSHFLKRLNIALSIYPNLLLHLLDEANNWVTQFVDWYNNDHPHSGIKFVTPSSRHEGNDQEI